VKKSRTIIVTVIVTLLAVFLIGGLLKCRGGGPKKEIIVRIEEAQRGELIEIVSAPGEIEPRTKVAISAKISARITELPYREGDTVTGGEANGDPPLPASVLMRLDAKDLESKLLSAEADRAAKAAQLEVEKARLASQQASLLGLNAPLKLAHQDVQRKKELLKSLDISQADFDQVQCKVDEQNAKYEAAKHTLEAAG
jgi:HlyD family secretion protein